MTSGQRYWLSGCLFASALVLAVYHLEWEGLEDTIRSPGGGYPSEERLVLPVYNTYRKIGFPDDPNAEILMRHGIYVRPSRNVFQGVVLGAFLPLVLVGAAGFIALGKRRARDNE
jgi:hypothetical protein